MTFSQTSDSGMPDIGFDDREASWKGPHFPIGQADSGSSGSTDPSGNNGSGGGGNP
ncbi:MAG: hypothetical protein AAF604_11525 [Acidobacteriota bacterium]